MSILSGPQILRCSWQWSPCTLAGRRPAVPLAQLAAVTMLNARWTFTFRPQFALALAAPRTRPSRRRTPWTTAQRRSPPASRAAVVLGPIRPARRVELPPLRATEGSRFTATLNDHEPRHAVTGQRREDLAGRSVVVHAGTHGWQIWAPTGRWLRVKDRKPGPKPGKPTRNVRPTSRKVVEAFDVPVSSVELPPT
jgi:hypothetical protein